jgi:integrase
MSWKKKAPGLYQNEATSEWKVDIQPGGRGGKRYRKTFRTKAEAKVYESWLKNQTNQDKEWTPDKRDVRKLSTLIEIWFDNHGSALRSGVNTKSRLMHLATALGNPVADRFNVDMFAAYRTKRIAQGISQNNLNREHAYLRSVFNELGRLGHWKRENPLANLRSFKIQQVELTFLTNAQITFLLDAMNSSRNPHVKLISKICLATGARWSEGEELTLSQLRPGMIEFARTKSGKVRGVPIDEALYSDLMKHAKKHNRVHRLFDYSISAFREAVERCGLVLPDGQMTHVLRHTFASHFMMNGGNILTLQRILGHANLTMTMRYAHLAPEHLKEAVKLNPLSRLTLG